MKDIMIINGPNLNLLGKRETGIYGNQSFETYFNELRNKFSSVNLQYYQSNIEGEIIDAVHQAGLKGFSIILNPGGYTHTSVAIGDAIAAVDVDVIEVHVSNIFSREEFRKLSYVSSRCIGVISGLGLKGYELAVEFLIEYSRPA